MKTTITDIALNLSHRYVLTKAILFRDFFNKGYKTLDPFDYEETSIVLGVEEDWLIMSSEYFSRNDAVISNQFLDMIFMVIENNKNKLKIILTGNKNEDFDLKKLIDSKLRFCSNFVPDLSEWIAREYNRYYNLSEEEKLIIDEQFINDYNQK